MVEAVEDLRQKQFDDGRLVRQHQVAQLSGGIAECLIRPEIGGANQQKIRVLATTPSSQKGG
ncbi:MAG: hypothetical protein ACLGHK_05315 [Alphaproteobacteria bacterium]